MTFTSEVRLQRRLPNTYLLNSAFCTLPSANFTLGAELHSALTNNSEFHRFADSVEVGELVTHFTPEQVILVLSTALISHTVATVVTYFTPAPVILVLSTAVISHTVALFCLNISLHSFTIL